LTFGDEPDLTSQLFRDLEIVHAIDEKRSQTLPLIVNYQLQGGYFTMPSARTFEAGNLGFGFSYLPPYHLWDLGFQFFDHLEITGNYWIFNGILDPTFGHLGFGDEAERAANLKFVVLRKEDGFPYLPDLALGVNDFIGTQRFFSFYVAATQEFLPINAEATVGWGMGRIQGFYGGVAWTPFRRSRHFWKGISLVAEYDANNYKKHPTEHAAGTSVSCKVNGGVQFQLGKYLRASASSIRGEDWAGSVALNYNLGETEGLFPKIYDVPVYSAPVNVEPIGLLRSREELGYDLAYALKEQGFDLYSSFLLPREGGEDELWLKVVNVKYREEESVRSRIEYALAALVPDHIPRVQVVVEADGVPVHTYHFRRGDLDRFRKGRLGEDEFRVIAPPTDVGSTPDVYSAALIYWRNKPIYTVTFRPWMRTYFGSSTGKIKYQTGIGAGIDGYLFDEVYYALTSTLTAFASHQSVQGQDFLNPSYLIQVRSDTVLFHQASSFHLDQAYLQKSWNLGKGWFSRLSLGYFETAYGGVNGEVLYYPATANWAVGFEIAGLWKRRYYGLWFDHKVRQYTPEGVFIRVPYTGLQYFFDLYYDYKPLSLDFKLSIGQFLARDQGIRLDVGRLFPSGLRVGFWYTFTNANDQVNGHRYYDKGFSITMPLDIFMNQTSRTRIGYAMSAWLRDCGAKAMTGKELHPTIYWERYCSRAVFY
jgi:hypothetical protein